MALRVLRQLSQPLAVGAAVIVAVVSFALRRENEPSPRRIVPSAPPIGIVGEVHDAAGPVEGARVRVRGERAFTHTDRHGRFRLIVSSHVTAPVTVAAWKVGYLIGGAEWDDTEGRTQGDSRQRPRLRIRLRPLPPRDNPDYAWVDPSPGGVGEHNCGDCHAEIYEEWNSSGHAHSVTNPRFLNLYDGTNWHGQPGHGWSLLDEHPHGAGVCAACHAPTIAFDHPGANDLRRVEGAAAHGVHCDFCHKVQEVDLAHVGRMHGRFAMRLLRPTEEQLFFGPLDDVTRDEDVFSPLQRESRYCASCHEGVVFGVHVYSTYSEWLESPAAREGRSCQSCHMAPTGRMTNFAPDAGGVERDPYTLASHSFLPGGREAMLRRCLRLEVDCRRVGDDAKVRVIVTATKVGHRVPTGFIDRHLVLAVEPIGADAQPTDTLPTDSLAASAGDAPALLVLPGAAGREFAGKPGRLFAKLLADEDGRPVPFWRGAREPVDTRLTPERPVVSEFRFPHADRVRVRLLYRRFWAEAAEAKSWPDETITIYDRTWAAR